MTIAPDLGGVGACSSAYTRPERSTTPPAIFVPPMSRPMANCASVLTRA